MFNLVPLILLFPALGITINLTLARRSRQPTAGIVASVAAGLAFIIALTQFAALLGQPQGQTITLLRWLEVGAFRADWAFQVDTLSVTMMLVVTGVGTLIHVYAIGYMRGDERFSRFFIYLNLFLVAMLILVSADNYLMMFAGWEGVGLCSFLLIGFWFDRPNGEGWKNSSAARKAFVVNRIGDFGFLLAMMLLWWTFGTLNFGDVFAGVALQTATQATMIAITLLLVLGAVGKSAQIPLFVWLPEAMAGPTPVSALIHAATMVTAGIYLIARSHVLFAFAPLTQEIVVLTGAITALLAASAAIGQWDIKRVLAYSTISQLGFMMAAVGMAAYSGGIFHLITHAFFKALLFLCAGAVIQASGHGNDMRLMGGLRRRLPLTFWTYVVGALSLAGIPPLAGFFSKDEILSRAWDYNPLVYVLLSAAAFLTAFYIGRQLFTVFFGQPRSEAAVPTFGWAHAVENPRVMTVPLLILAGLTIFGGLLNFPGVESFAGWLSRTTGETGAGEFQPLVAGISLILAVLGLGLAYVLYGRQSEVGHDPLAERYGRLFSALQQCWGIDRLYQRTIVRLYDTLGVGLAWVDEAVFKGFDWKVIGGARIAAQATERTETGQLNWNVVAIIAGLVLVLGITFWMGGR
jgi:NADH-quinone oxidoreductase subunit L